MSISIDALANLDTQSQVQVALLLLVPLLAVVFMLRPRSLPGNLRQKGTFEHEDPANSVAVAERRRDFCRIVATKRDLWIFTSENRQPAVSLPVDLPMGMGPDGGDTAVAEKVCYNKLKWWLQQELGRIPGAIDLGMTSQWTVVDRIMYFISASPGFDFAMRHKVPPRILQPKYLILVSNGGQVRVAWFAFVSNNADPGATAGPFVVKLVSEDLRSADRDLRTFSKFTYTTRPAASSDMEKIISAMVPAILKGVDNDKWDAFEKA